MPVTAGITWAFVGPITERWESGSQSVTFGARVSWANRILWRRAMLGYATHTEPNPLLTRTLPYRYPEPDSKLICTTIESSEGKGIYIATGVGADQVLEHVYRDEVTSQPTRTGDAWYRVTCTSQSYRVIADGGIASELDRFTTERVRASGESQRIARGTWVFITDAGVKTDVQFQEESAMPVMLRQFAWTLLGVPKLPPLLKNAIGKVNQNAFFGPFGGEQYLPETLLMDPPQIEPRVGADLNLTYDLTINVLHRSSSWNRLWRNTDPRPGAPADSPPGFYPVISLIGTRKPYEPYPFESVFSQWQTP